MFKLFKKSASYIISAFLIGILVAPAVFAQTEEDTTATEPLISCDADGDGYISLAVEGVDVILPGFSANGSYTALEWQNFYNTFKNDPDQPCGVLTFKKGAEPSRCDSLIVTAASGVYDPAKVRTLAGSSVNPASFDQPDNGIDENCDGLDETLIAATGQEKELGGLVNKVIVWLSRAVAVVSIGFLIYGGMMYTTAAGDEQKTGKARKAIIGAIIGLAVGLLAPSVVNWIIASLA